MSRRAVATTEAVDVAPVLVGSVVVCVVCVFASLVFAGALDVVAGLVNVVDSAGAVVSVVGNTRCCWCTRCCCAMGSTGAVVYVVDSLVAK